MCSDALFIYKSSEVGFHVKPFMIDWYRLDFIELSVLMSNSLKSLLYNSCLCHQWELGSRFNSNAKIFTLTEFHEIKLIHNISSPEIILTFSNTRRKVSRRQEGKISHVVIFHITSQARA